MSCMPQDKEKPLKPTSIASNVPGKVSQNTEMWFISLQCFLFGEKFYSVNAGSLNLLVVNKTKRQISAIRVSL